MSWSALKKWWHERHERRRLRVERRWQMSESKAQSTANAIFYEIGAVEAGAFMDEWKRRNEKSS